MQLAILKKNGMDDFRSETLQLGNRQFGMPVPQLCVEGSVLRFPPGKKLWKNTRGTENTGEFERKCTRINMQM